MNASPNIKRNKMNKITQNIIENMPLPSTYKLSLS